MHYDVYTRLGYTHLHNPEPYMYLYARDTCTLFPFLSASSSPCFSPSLFTSPSVWLCNTYRVYCIGDWEVPFHWEVMSKKTLNASGVISWWMATSHSSQSRAASVSPSVDPEHLCCRVFCYCGSEVCIYIAYCLLLSSLHMLHMW